MKISTPLKQRTLNSHSLSALLLLLFILFPSFGAQAEKQEVTITRNQRTIVEALEEVEKQTGFNIAYNDNVQDLEKSLSVEIRNGVLEDALTAILKGTDTSFLIQDGQIIISDYLPPSGSSEIKEYRGIVTDESGNPIIGATVVLQGTGTGTITNSEGAFVIKSSIGETLTVSFLGYETRKITLGESTTLQVVIREDMQIINEVVVVGYGTQRKGNLTGSISSVNSDKITVAPVTSITNTLAGHLPGLGSKQVRGTPGSDEAEIWIRGFSGALVIVDGAESSMNHLDPSQVESITILKDASASIYGARAGNGVILVTTKRGTVSKPMIGVHSSLTMQGSTNIFPATSSWQRAQLKREQHINGELPLSQVPYTEAEIQKFKDGTDPNYGNYNWFKATIRDWAPQQNHNVSVRGGSERIKYYGYFGYNKQETLFKNEGGYYDRFNLQSSIDANVTDRIKVSVDFATTRRKEYFSPIEGPNSHNVWAAVYASDPAFPTSLPDPDRLSYANQPMSSIYMTSTKWAGYTDTRNTHLRSSGSVSYDFKYVPGLTAKAMIYHNYYVQNIKSFTKQQDFFLYDFENDRYTLAGSSTTPTRLVQQSNVNSDLTQQYSLSYNNVFNEIHNFSALAVYEGIKYDGNGFNTSRSGFNSTAVEQFAAGDPATASNGSWSSEMGRVSWIGRLNYSLMNRYLIETIIRADASGRFPKDKRWGYFPSVSAGWVASEEEFLRQFAPLDYLKLRLSMGKAGYDNIGDFNYLSTYSFDGEYKIGDKIVTGIFPTRMANNAFTWEKMTTYNVGIDYAFYKRKLYGTVEGFYRKRKGILANRNSSLPSTFGSELPTENINSEDTRGFEFSVGSFGTAGDFVYDISANISWNRSKYVYRDEPEYDNDDQKRIYGRSGRWKDINYGYVSDGLFTSIDEIESLPYMYADINGNSTLRPGDIKYKDLNGDGKIDWRDQTIIGKGNKPNWMFGINGVFQYMDFDLSLLFQGAFGYSTYVTLDPLTTEYAFNRRWTTENNDPKAIVPRYGSNGLNYLYSDYYLHNTAYIRLKNASFGYSLPKKLMEKSGIGKVRVYVAGTNIFTLSTLDKYGVNPEQSDGSPISFYPMQRTISFGVDITF